MQTATKEPLHRTAELGPTDYWNDSCSVEELDYAVARGAVGATSNPAIVLEVLKKDPARWRARIREIHAAEPAWTDVEVTWAIVEEMAVEGAAILAPVFERHGGTKGRLSIQTNPTFWSNAERMVEQGVRLAGLAPNMQVKFLATSAGIAAIEEATSRGVNINATVSFTVPQAIAAAEAVQRGLARREAAGVDTSGMRPVITMMIGRLDDWMKAVSERDAIIVRPDAADWAGIAAIKRAYGIFHERGYRARLLAAAYRHHRHWSELIGGDIILTIPYAWQRKFNASAVEVTARFDRPVDPEIVAELLDRIPDYRRAYEPGGLSIAEFDTFGATVRTLRAFVKAYYDLVAVIDDAILPNPDLK